MGAIEPSVRRAEIERAQRKRPENLDAYDLYLRALPHVWPSTPDDSNKAIEFLEDALRIDPSYVPARGYAASCYMQQRNWGGPNEAGRKRQSFMPTPSENPIPMTRWPSAARASRSLCWGTISSRREIARPSRDPQSQLGRGMGRSAIVHALMGHIGETIEHAERALRLSPFDPLRRLGSGP